MPESQRSKFRGSRTCGGGTHKNRRGAGSRGGRGHVGACKHHFVRWYLQGFRYGKDGFNPVRSSPSRTMDVGFIDENIRKLLDLGIAKQEGEVIRLNMNDLGIDKVLGSGRVTHRLNISAKAFSEQAKEKIAETGGQAEVA
ncbi:MAG TPA: uL15 family ribosomal protein [Methanomicrobiales archaeon]|nr:uL15 family ribosomal protein [Methanomicrobiales archaeon]